MRPIPRLSSNSADPAIWILMIPLSIALTTIAVMVWFSIFYLKMSVAVLVDVKQIGEIRMLQTYVRCIAEKKKSKLECAREQGSIVLQANVLYEEYKNKNRPSTQFLGCVQEVYTRETGDTEKFAFQFISQKLQDVMNKTIDILEYCSYVKRFELPLLCELRRSCAETVSEAEWIEVEYVHRFVRAILLRSDSREQSPAKIDAACSDLPLPLLLDNGGTIYELSTAKNGTTFLSFNFYKKFGCKSLF
ncbi:hypothetical protein M3Y95_00631500 [Aphelenchoides besseyi]|nr:hypothetical protein M3Y95_00631500 [Aphelenchoides besseyi]